jgi:putative chitinase
MSIQVTLDQMEDMGIGASKPALLSSIADLITNRGDEFFLDTVLRVVHFLGQTAWESNYYSNLEENLNYSAKRMTQVWPNHFKTLAAAKPYANNPKALANFIYGSTSIAKSLGNTQKNDGWNFRGRGIKQLTGRANYTRFNTWVHKYYPDAPDFVKDPDKVLDLPWAILSAVWFWVDKKVYLAADRDDATAVTKTINGGTNGLKERIVATNKAKKIFVAVKPSVLVEKKPRKADPELKEYQDKLKRIADYKAMPEFDPGKIDGWHGKKTEDAIRAFQLNTGKLKVDGVLGAETREAIDNVIAVIDTGKQTSVAEDIVAAETPVPPAEPEEVPVSIPTKLVQVLDKPIVEDKSLWTLITGGGGVATFLYNSGQSVVAWFNGMSPIVQVTILLLFAIATYLIAKNILDFYKARKGLKELKKKNEELIQA